MKSRTRLRRRAITTFSVGMALFLLGCQPKPALEAPPVKVVLPDEFDLGEKAFQTGAYNEALEKYELYLQQYPVGEKSRTALVRMARIYHAWQRHDKALALLERVAKEYPSHPQRPEVDFEIATIQHRLGAYEQSRNVGEEWLERYPRHPLKGEILFLMGKGSWALGDNIQALYWWLKASAEFEASSERASEIADRIIQLIQDSNVDELQEMTQYAAGSDYVPLIYQQMATVYLDLDQLEEAKNAAMALVRSTPEQYWVSIGRQILEGIDEELSVRRGVLGCLLPLSGPFAIYGQEVLNGIELGLGIWGRSEDRPGLELIIKDTQGKVEEAVLSVEELAKEEKVMAIIGPLASKPTLAAAKRAEELGIPIVTLTQKEGITAEGEMVFRNFLTPSKEIQSLLDKVMNEMELKRFAILYPDNPYGHFFMDLFWERVEEMGGTVRAVESYKPEQTDFAVEIKKMVGLHYPRPELVAQTLMKVRSMEWENEIEHEQSSEEEPEPIVDFDAVFIPDNPQRVALIAPQLPFYSIFNVRLLGTSLWQSPELIEIAGDYLQGAIFPSGFFANNPSEGVKNFIQLYRENFESEPGILAASGYDTIRFMKDLMQAHLIKTRRELRSKILYYEDFYGVTGWISFDEKGEVEKAPILLTISGKRFKITPNAE